MIQQAIDFRDESEALYRLLAPLSEADFERPTQFKGWTVHDVVSHLHAWNRAADLSLNDPPAFADFRTKLLTEMAGGRALRAVETDWLDGAKNRARLEQWREFYNHRRPHSSLDNRTPVQARQEALRMEPRLTA